MEGAARSDVQLRAPLRPAISSPAPIHTDRDNISPRFGFAWSPNAKTVLRGSFGIFYDRIPTRATSTRCSATAASISWLSWARHRREQPVFPNVLAAQPSVLVTKPAITRIDPNIENNSSHQANLQFERDSHSIRPSRSVISTFAASHIILSRNINVPRCTAAIDANLLPPESQFRQYFAIRRVGKLKYNGLVFSLNKRQGKWATGRISYTLSKSKDDSGTSFSRPPQDNFDRAGEWGRSDNDQRHRLTLSGTLNTPSANGGSVLKRIYGDFQLGWIFTYSSRLPFNIVTGNDRNSDTTTNDRPTGVGRNEGAGFDYASLDLRLSRRFAFTEKMGLELLVEGFNLLNRSNLSVRIIHSVRERFRLQRSDGRPPHSTRVRCRLVSGSNFKCEMMYKSNMYRVIFLLIVVASFFTACAQPEQISFTSQSDGIVSTFSVSQLELDAPNRRSRLTAREMFMCCTSSISGPKRLICISIEEIPGLLQGSNR